MRVIVSRPAQAEIRAAVRWLEGDRPGTGRELLIEVENGFRWIGERPLAWARYLEGTRRHVIAHFQYAVVCRVDSDAVRVIGFAHTRQPPGYWIGRKV